MPMLMLQESIFLSLQETGGSKKEERQFEKGIILLRVDMQRSAVG